MIIERRKGVFASASITINGNMYTHIFVTLEHLEKNDKVSFVAL